MMVSTGAVLATTPIQLLAFGTITPVAILANLAAIPIAAFATAGPRPGPGAHADSGRDAGRRARRIGRRGGARRPGAGRRARCGAARRPPSPSTAPAFAALGAAVVAVWLLRPGPRRRPARGTLGFRLVATGLAVCALLSGPPLSGRLLSGRPLWPPDVDGDGRLTLHFLDVGQGDAAALRTPHGS